MSGKPILLVVGDRQAAFLAHVARQVPALRDQFEIAFTARSADLTDAVRSGARTVWLEVDVGVARMDARLPSECQVLRFPSLALGCVWPFAGTERRPTGPGDDASYPWGDSVAESLASTIAGEDPSDDVVFAAYMRRSADAMPDLGARLEQDAARARAVDAMADFPMWGWIEAGFRTTKLFHAADSPDAALFAVLLGQLLPRTAALPRDRSARAMREALFLLRGTTGLDVESGPVHPLVAERLALTWYDPDALYRWHGHRWTHREYVLKYIRREPYMP